MLRLCAKAADCGVREENQKMMVLQGATLEELREGLEAARKKGERIERVALLGWKEPFEHRPQDLTVTAGAGITLEELQSRLARCGQWLPVDPPFPQEVTVGQLIAKNLSGPRRFGYGALREYLLGLTALVGNGEVVRLGGKVVKNVAGYDLHRLFVGSRGSLGIILEATFKLLPLPEEEIFLRLATPELEEALEWIERIVSSDLQPVVLDLFREATTTEKTGCYELVVGFAGLREEVSWQKKRWEALGFPAEPASLDYEEIFWMRHGGGENQKLSVLPSRLGDPLRVLGEESFLARAGNGIVYHTGKPLRIFDQAYPGSLQKLWLRVKQAFDPEGVLPEVPQ
jgi:FAD/FMN-containing dehydrogenase